MKSRLLFLLICLIISGNIAFAQAPEQNCITGIPVCQPIYTQPNSYVGYGTINELDNTNQDCLSSGEKNSVWYIINVTSSGVLAFTINPNQASNDYDWALWDITGGGCPMIYDYNNNTPNPYPPIRCNYSGTPGLTGMTSAGTLPSCNAGQSPFSTTLNVTFGQTFALCVSNFSSNVVGYTLDFSTSTAAIYDTVKPRFLSAGSLCGFAADNVDVHMKKPILCSSLASNGSDFTYTPAVGGITITGASSPNCSITGASVTSFNVQFSNTLPAGTYWLHSHVGTDGNTLLDPCGNLQPLDDSIQFIMNLPNPPVIVHMDTPACLKTRLILNRGVSCATIDPAGSDFKITGPGTVKVVRAVPWGCDNNLTDTIDVFFDSSIAKPGNYTLSIVTGNDGNAIADTCGLVISNSVSWNVSDAGLTATATPNLLCYPGYTSLTSIIAPSILPPPPPVTACGVTNYPCSGNQNSVEAGNGSASINAGSPFAGASKDSRTQMLFTASELQGLGITAGTIRQIAFNIITQQSTKPYNNFTIKMGCTTNTSFSGTFEPGMQVVYEAKDYSATGGWNYFNLDNPYNWDGTTSLVVEICYHLNGAASSNDIIQGTTLSTNQLFYKNANNGQGCALSSSGGGLSTTRPNMLISYCTPTTPAFPYTWAPDTYIGDAHAGNTDAYIQHTTIYSLFTIDQNYCYRRDTARVILSVRNPSLEPTDTSMCSGKQIPLHAGGGTNYIWYPATGLSCSNCSDPIATPETTTTYHVAIFDQYGCSDTMMVRVVVHPLPVLTLNVHDTTIQYGDPLQLNVASPGASFYYWEPNIYLDNGSGPSPIASPDTAITYTVTVIDTNNCTMSDTVHINTYEQPVEVPSAFTPNNDGKNDVFRVAHLTTQKLIEFRVFNRWGQEVYHAEGNNDGWDGTYAGIPQDIGTYTYLIRVAFHDGQVKTFQGSVTLIR